MHKKWSATTATVAGWLAIQKKLDKVVTVNLEKPPRTEGGDKVQCSVNPRFAAGLPFPVSEILEFKALCDLGKQFPKIS